MKHGFVKNDSWGHEPWRIGIIEHSQYQLITNNQLTIPIAIGTN